MQIFAQMTERICASSPTSLRPAYIPCRPNPAQLQIFSDISLYRLPLSYGTHLLSLCYDNYTPMTIELQLHRQAAPVSFR